VQRVIPSLVYEDIPAAHDYLVRVFGFGAGSIDRDEEGRPVHAELEAGEGVVYLHRVAPEFRVASPASLGADTAGFREYGARDLEGRLWSFMTPLG
jgi:uncharacterized glyoxalase superfamily protein PhnB